MSVVLQEIQGGILCHKPTVTFCGGEVTSSHWEGDNKLKQTIQRHMQM